jgi:hypothetical protein
MQQHRMKIQRLKMNLTSEIGSLDLKTIIRITNNTEPELFRDITNDNVLQSQHSSNHKTPSAFKIPKSKIPNKDVVYKKIPIFK